MVCFECVCVSKTVSRVRSHSVLIGSKFAFHCVYLHYEISSTCINISKEFSLDPFACHNSHSVRDDNKKTGILPGMCSNHKQLFPQNSRMKCVFSENKIQMENNKPKE